MGWFDDNAPDRSDMGDQGPPPPDQAPGPPPPPAPPPKQTYYSWQDTPAGKMLINRLMSTFGISEDEARTHLAYPQMPDANFFDAIMANLRQARNQPKPPGQTAPTTPKPPTTPFDANEFWKLFEDYKTAHPEGTAAQFDEFIKSVQEAHPDWKLDVHGGNVGLPNGEYWDLVNSYGAGGKGWQKYPRGGGGGDGDATLLDPWTGQFEYPPFEPPPPFEAPTGEEVFHDPGFMFRLSEGQKALERSAAAKGTLLTTGTVKDLDAFTQDLASQEYGNVYGRRLGEYESRYGHATNDYERDRGNTLNDYLLARENFWQNEDRPFNKLLALTGVGANAAQNYLTGSNQYANNYSNLLLGGANNQSNYYQQSGNLSGNSQMYNSNLWGNFWNNAFNTWAQTVYNMPWNTKKNMPPGWTGGT